MAHPETDAVEAPVALYGQDADAAFEDMFGDEPADADEEPDEEGATEEAADEPEGDDANDDDDSEPETPAIAAPSSLTADEKAKFADLPSEAQTLIAEIEGRRNAQVSRVTMEAAEAKRNAELNATTKFAEQTRAYANELEQYAEAFRPQMPDPSLVVSDPQQYAYEVAQYQQLLAHSDQIATQAAAAKRQAAQMEEQASGEWNRQQYRALIAAVPEWADETVLRENLGPLLEMARTKGFTEEALTDLSAQDVLFLKEHAELIGYKAEVMKLRKLNMAKVRTFKGTTAKPGVAQPRTDGAQKAVKTAVDRLRADPYDAKRQEDALAAFL